MHCPVCKQAMIVLELDQVEIDHCPQCGGVWLDAGELDLLMQDTAESRNFLAEMKKTSTREKFHRCPICGRKMAKAEFPANPPVVIDRCNRNHGIWLDQGELEAVIAAAGGDETNIILTLLKDMFAGESKI